jgi:DNA anti-recombination protein RmuC
MAYCSRLQADFGKFKEDFELVGKHLGNAHDRFIDAGKRLGKFETKLEQATESQPLEPPAEARELPRVVDAA